MSLSDNGVATRSFQLDAPVGDLGPGSGPAVTFATTEHFNLQTARALTVSEANGRASIYLTALASNLIALAFIGQMSRLGTAFYAFALILLPVLAFVGTVTFLRLVQSSVEDIAFAHRIALLRSYYLRVAPELEPYLVVVREARPGTTANEVRPAAAAWQLTLTAAGMVAVVNSVVVAACAGLVLVAAGVDSLAIPVAVGALVGAAAFSSHERHHRRALDAYSPEAVDRVAISARLRNRPTRPEQESPCRRSHAVVGAFAHRSTGARPAGASTSWRRECLVPGHSATDAQRSRASARVQGLSGD